MCELYRRESSADVKRKTLPVRMARESGGVSFFRAWLPLFCLLLGSAAAAAATAPLAVLPTPNSASASASSSGPESPPAIELSAIEASGRQLDLGLEESVVLTTLLSVEARETIVIKDIDGKVIRKLVDLCRPPGDYEDAWDGNGENRARLKDGQYRWVATLDDGLHLFTIDRSRELDGDFEVKSHPEYSVWAPFENIPLRFTHTFERPGEVVLVFSRDLYYVTPRCDPPRFFCRFLDGYQPAGEFTYEWAGVDDTGARREDIHGIFVISHHEQLSKNAVVLHGGTPRVTGVTVTPSTYRPDFGLQDVAFSLATCHSDHVSATIIFTNQESRSALRTLSLTDVAPGRVKATWDGRADGGNRVAPGPYTVTVRVVDSLGQKSIGEILTTVEY